MPEQPQPFRLEHNLQIFRQQIVPELLCTQLVNNRTELRSEVTATDHRALSQLPDFSFNYRLQPPRTPVSQFVQKQSQHHKKHLSLLLVHDSDPPQQENNGQLQTGILHTHNFGTRSNTSAQPQHHCFPTIDQLTPRNLRTNTSPSNLTLPP